MHGYDESKVAAAGPLLLLHLSVVGGQNQEKGCRARSFLLQLLRKVAIRDNIHKT